MILQVTLQEGCNKILVADCFTLLQRQFVNTSRGLNLDEDSLCGGCGGRIVRTKDQTDAFIFNCKHAFHSECFHEEFETTNHNATRCVLCHAK